MTVLYYITSSHEGKGKIGESMFEPRFTTLNMNEILKYLGFRGQ